MPNFKTNHRGSILIWTVLLGVVLTSVFFFFAMRLRATTATQRDSIAMQSAESFLESYADYLEKNPSEIASINFDGIAGSLTQKDYVLEGFLDSGKNITYTDFTGSLRVEWNKCEGNMEGDLLFKDGATELLVFTHTSGHCLAEAKYKDSFSYTVANGNFTLQAVSAPFYYRLTSQSGTPITDNKWHLNASMTLPYGKKVEIQREFP